MLEEELPEEPLSEEPEPLPDDSELPLDSDDELAPDEPLALDGEPLEADGVGEPLILEELLKEPPEDDPGGTDPLGELLEDPGDEELLDELLLAAVDELGGEPPLEEGGEPELGGGGEPEPGGGGEVEPGGPGDDICRLLTTIGQNSGGGI